MNEILEKLIKKHKFLIASHRGYRAGNIIENTFLAMKASIICGADIVELDVSVSRNNDIYVFHDGNEKRLINKECNISKLTSLEIDKCRYINNIGNITNYTPEKLSYIHCNLEKIKDQFDFLINIDRSWNYLEIVLDEIEKFNIKSRCIIKTPLKDKYINILMKRQYKFMYMALIKTKEDLKMYKKIKNSHELNIIGIEYSGNIKDENIVEILEKDKILWINSLRLSTDKRLYEEYDDDNSILGYPNNIGWLKMVDKGFNVIQTDFPAIVKTVRDMEDNDDRV